MRASATDRTTAFDAERPRLVRLAARLLGDPVEAEDIVQQAWLRLHGTDQDVRDLPAWLTTVTSRLCLDRLRARVPTPATWPEETEVRATGPTADEHVGDPAEQALLTDAVGAALHVVLDRLTPAERIAFVLHDSFAVDFATVAAVLDSTPAAARKLASRARAKVAEPAPAGTLAAAAVVDAFLAAARGGDLGRLLTLLAPDVVVAGDTAAVATGTPARIAGREQVAAFFDGAARAAFPAMVGDRPGAAWWHRGEAKVAFDFTVRDGTVSRIDFRADPDLLATVRRRGVAGAGATAD